MPPAFNGVLQTITVKFLNAIAAKLHANVISKVVLTGSALQFKNNFLFWNFPKPEIHTVSSLRSSNRIDTPIQ